MTDTSTGFRSELRDTYRDPASVANPAEPADVNGATAQTEPVDAQAAQTNPTTNTENGPVNEIGNEMGNEQIPAAAKKVYAGATTAGETALVWTSEQRTSFTLLMAGFSMLVGISSWLAVVFTSAGSLRIASHDSIAVLFGLALGGINIGLAVSIVLWQLLKSSRKLTLPLAVSNLFLLLLNLPIGIAIGANIYYITGGSIEFKELLTAPLALTARFYWVPFLVMPAALIAWQLEMMLIKRFFTGTEYLFQPAERVAGAGGGSFTVRRRNVAARCDICHKEDQFIAKTSFCRRCQRYTF